MKNLDHIYKPSFKLLNDEEIEAQDRARKAMSDKLINLCKDVAQKTNVKYPYIDWCPETCANDFTGHFYIFFSKNLYVTILEDLMTPQVKAIEEILEKLRND